MLSSLNFVTKCLLEGSFSRVFAHCNLRAMGAALSSSASLWDKKPLPPVVDINMDMMFEDSDGELQSVRPQHDAPLNTTTINDTPVAPVDINPWVDHDEEKQGTVEIEEQQVIKYPPIPTERLGKYEFKGIRVVLPSKMLRPETYRYRLDPEAEASLADDIRVCKFEK